MRQPVDIGMIKHDDGLTVPIRCEVKNNTGTEDTLTSTVLEKDTIVSNSSIKKQI